MADERLAEILGSWRDRRDRGEHIDPEVLIREHPDLADALRARFRAIAELERHLGAAEPKNIGEYRILREIGRGGMGVVYEAEQVSMHRRVALKVLYPSVTSLPKAVKRFQQEAWAAGRVKHTNIVAVHDLGQDHGVWYFAMELVEGRPLSDVISDLRQSRGRPRESRLARRAAGVETKTSITGKETGTRAYYCRVAEMFADVAEALQVAHDQGVIHRDLKPGNLLLDAEGNLKLVDFGLARLEDSAGMTMTGDIVGTPYYMSPEQIAGRRGELDHRTDVYSLGATLYEALALRPPFHGENLQAVTARILREDPSPLRRWDRSIPRDLETIVGKALEKEPDRRYRTAEELAKDLRQFAQGGGIRARRIGLLGRGWRKARRHKLLAGTGAALALALVVAGIFAFQMSRTAFRTRELEYERLCRRGQAALIQTGAQRDVLHLLLYPGESSAEIFTKAIALSGDRFEAYVGRALASGRSAEERLADLDAARQRGLSERARLLGRADILFRAWRTEEATAAEQAAAPLPRGTWEETYFETSLSTFRGDFKLAEAKCTEIVDGAPEDSFLRALALEARVDLRRHAGDYAGALADAARMQAMDKSCYPAIVIALLWERLGKGEESKRILDELREEARAEGTELAWRNLVNACASADRDDWTVLFADEALRNHPDSVEILLDHAHAMNSLDRPEEALRSAQRAVAVAPQNADAQALLAISNRGNPEESLLALERARGLGLPARSFFGLRSNIYATADRHAEAEVAEREALRLDPANAQLWHNLAFSLDRQHRFGEALAASDRALALRPAYAKALHMRGSILNDLFRYAEALDLLERSLALEETPGALADLANVRCHLGRFEESTAAADRALELLAGRSDTREARYSRALATGHRAWALFKLGRAEEAEKAFAKALEVERVPQIFMLRVRMLNDQGRHAEAEPLAREAAQTLPEHHDKWEQLGRALYGLGRLDEALEAQLRSRDRSCSNSYFHLGLTLYDLGRPQEAIEAWTESLRIQPNSFQSLANRGIALWKSGDTERAGADFVAVLRLAPNDQNAHNTHATFLRDTGRLQNLLEECAAACAFPENDWRRHFWRAHHLLHHLGDAQAALTELDHAERCRSGETNSNIELLRFRALHGAGSPEESLASLERLLENDPDHPDATLTKGRILLQLGRQEDAVAWLEGCASRRPSWPPAHEALADVLLALGRHAEAEEAIDRALERIPHHPGLTDRKAQRLAERGATDEALVLVERARERWPDDLPLVFKHAALLQAAARFEEALDLWEIHLKRQPAPDAIENAMIAALHCNWWERLRDLARLGSQAVPGNALFLGMEALAHASLGDHDAALDALRRGDGAERGKSGFFAEMRIEVPLLAGRADEALRVADASYEKAPRTFAFEMVRVLRALGHADKAAALAARHAAEYKEPLGRAYLYAVAGRGEDARRALASADPCSAHSFRQHALVHAVLGDKAKAREFIDEALRRGWRLAPNAALDADLAPLLDASDRLRLAAPR